MNDIVLSELTKNEDIRNGTDSSRALMHDLQQRKSYQ